MFKSHLTGAQVLEVNDTYTVLYKGYSIKTTKSKTEAIMASICRERCEELLEEKSCTYQKSA